MFVAGSALCGASFGIGSLIVFRIVQACGSAMTASTSPALAAVVAMPGERGRAMGWIGTAVAVGLSAGPPLGGILLSIGSWRWIFLISFPLGIFAVAGALAFLPGRSGSRDRSGFDLTGSVLMGLALAAILLGSSYGRTWGWGSWKVSLLLIGGGILLVAFIFQEKRAESPVMPFMLFKNRVFSSAVWSAALLYCATIGISFLVVFYLTYGLGLGGLELGLVMAVQPLGSAVSAPFSGRASDKIGSRPLVVAGTMMVTLAMISMWITCDIKSIWSIAVPLAFIGLGFGAFGSPNSSAILGAAPRELLGVAGGVLATARTLGMAVGVAIAGVVFGNSFASATGGLEIGNYKARMFAALVHGFRNALVVAVIISIGAVVLALLRGRDNVRGRGRDGGKESVQGDLSAKMIPDDEDSICEPPEPCG